MAEIDVDDVRAASPRVEGVVRPLTVTGVGPIGARTGLDAAFALEFLQHTGTFKARGAVNFLRAHKDAGLLPDAGVTIASGGNAGVACAWAARREGVRATVFLPESAPPVKVARLRALDADVRLRGTEYADALAECRRFATGSGALVSHAYDHPLIAAGAGTLMLELHERMPSVGTVVIAVGGGGLLSGVATAAHHLGVRTLAVEPRGCAALAAALDAGGPVDSPVDSIAADSLGARRVSTMAYGVAIETDSHSIVVDDASIIAARQMLWDEHRMIVEHAAATAVAGALDDAGRDLCRGDVAIVLCGANTDPAIGADS